MFQHFAVVLGGSLLSVPFLNDHIYPAGLTTAGRSLQISGDFSRATARGIAAELNALTYHLRVVSRH